MLACAVEIKPVLASKTRHYANGKERQARAGAGILIRALEQRTADVHPSPLPWREEEPAPCYDKSWRSVILCDGRRGTLSFGACHYPQVRLSFLNPKGIVSSSPGLRAASYPGKREFRKHPTPTGLRLQATTGGHNPVGVGAFWSSSPRVARCSQPWALRRNPFGIRLLDDATCGECSALRGREHRSQSLGIFGRARPAAKLTILLPLPEGEGRGEGEQATRLSRLLVNSPRRRAGW